MILPIDLKEKSYNIILERGAIRAVGAQVNRANRRVCVVTDDGVPAQYAQAVLSQLQGDPLLFTFAQGEQSKTFDTYLALQKTLLDAGFTRGDAVVAVGGGVVGDLAGFAAATYMRGIDFYNVPTTLLSQLDSSIGGKTAVDLGGYKNMIGAFWQPRAVFVDPDTLLTLPRRQAAAGLAEAVKMAVTSDAALFSIFEQQSVLPLRECDAEEPTVADIADEQTMDVLETVIARALAVKRDVVEQDEREAGLRRVLNFGHTLGHAVETCAGLSALYHGECVAIGMLPMCDGTVRARVRAVLQRLGLPTEMPSALEPLALKEAMTHDKKATGATIRVVLSEEIGSFSFADMSTEQLLARAYATLGEGN